MTADSGRCPRCSSDRVVAGDLLGGNIAVHFHLRDLRPMHAGSLPLGGPNAAPIASTPNGHACCDCGLVWGELDATEVRFRLREGGTDELKARLRLDQAPPTPDGRPVFPPRGGRHRDAAG